MYKIAMYPNASASRYWRLEDPAKYLRRLGHEVVIFTEPVTKDMCKYFDAFVTQGMVDKNSIALLYEYQQEHGKKIIVDQDDDLKVDASNPHLKDHEITDASAVVQRTIEIADLVTTTTDTLRKKLTKYNKNVQVFQNYMDFDRWDLPLKTHKTDQIRILWCGSITHLNDLKPVLPVLARLQREYPQIKYIFMGEPRIRQYLNGLNAEVMYGVPFEAYPEKLHSIAADIGIAPLAKTEFNRNKSQIKFLEYAICQYAGIYSYTVYHDYINDGSTGTIACNDEQWYLGLRNYIVCPELRKDIKERAYSYVKSWYNLAERIKILEKAYTKLWTSSALQPSQSRVVKASRLKGIPTTFYQTQPTLNP